MGKEDAECPRVFIPYFPFPGTRDIIDLVILDDVFSADVMHLSGWRADARPRRVFFCCRSKGDQGEHPLQV